MSAQIGKYFYRGASSRHTKILTQRIPDALFKKIHETMPVVCVDIVVKHSNKFLLVKRKNNPAKGEWYLPGGRVLKNETLEHAALRKLYEETNLRGRVKMFVGVGEHYYGPRAYYRGIISYVISLVLIVEPKNVRAVRLDSQGEAFSWFDRIDRRWHPYVKDFLRKAGFME